MALLMVQEGVPPLGQYDGYSTFHPVGGEVGVLISTGVDTNGYQVLAVRGATTGDTGPFFLVDEGKLGYGVLFGNTVTKTATGFASGSDTATRLGPNSMDASNKITLWDKPGLYAVSLDALVGTEASYKAAAPGTALYVDAATSKLKLTSSGSGSVLARVVAYKVDEALVTTGGAQPINKKLVIMWNSYVSATTTI